MTERTFAYLKAEFQHRDPQDWTDDLLESIPALTGSPQLVLQAITFASATLTLTTVPVNSILGRVFIARTTAWDAITTFTGGKTGTLDWLWTTAQANLDGAIPAGESQDVEVINMHKAVDAATPIIVTINQGGATQGSGYIVFEFFEEVPPS